MNIRASSVYRKCCRPSRSTSIPTPATSSRHAKRCAQRRSCRTGSSATSTPITSRRCLGRRSSTYIEDPVVRDNAMRLQAERVGAPPYGLNGDLGLRYQIGRRPHSASGRPARNRRGHRRPSRRHPDAPGDGFARHRQHGGVSDADAVPRHASAAGNGGVARQRL